MLASMKSPRPAAQRIGVVGFGKFDVALSLSHACLRESFFMSIRTALLATALSMTTTATIAGTTDVPLIPRDTLFGNPERAGVQISPNGKWIS